MLRADNRVLQKETENEAIRASGQLPLEDQLTNYFNSRIEEEKKRAGEGAKIPHDRMMEIYGDCLRRLRAETRRSTIDAHGEFSDFLEVRRPFIAPNNEAVSH